MKIFFPSHLSAPRTVPFQPPPETVRSIREAPGNPYADPAMIRVVIAAGIRFYREGLAEALPRHGDIKVVAVEATASAVAALITDDTVADVVVMDGSLPDALSIVRSLKSRLPDIHVIVVAVDDTPDNVIEWAEAGVSGYASREDSIDDLSLVLMDATCGRLRCSADVAAGIMKRLHALSSRPRHNPEPSPLGQLTNREVEITELVSEGLSNKRIARTLGISIATTKNHIHHILQKLNVGRRGEAAALVRKWSGSSPNRTSHLSAHR